DVRAAGKPIQIDVDEGKHTLKVEKEGFETHTETFTHRADKPTRLTVRLTWPRELANSIGIKLVRIPAGKFRMGSPAEETGHNSDEEQHEAEITRPFWLGACEVTQAQFKQVTGYNPSHFSVDGKGKEGTNYAWNPSGGFAKVPVDTRD